MRILLIEDDMVLGAARRDQLVGDGHSVDQVQRLDAAHTALASVSYDLVLLDLTLPGGILIPFFKKQNKYNSEKKTTNTCNIL
jgi:two-component system OmpR family response regulator